MRVIAGTAKGRGLSVPRNGVRPTAGRVKEAMFSILGARMEGLSVLDAFSGSGSLGIEALSRGANIGVFVDSDRNAVKCIRSNLDQTGLFERAQIVSRDAFRYLKEYDHEPFDILLMDPPYDFAQKHIEDILQAVAGSKAIGPDSRFILEVGKRVSVPTITGLALVDERLYGDTKLVSFRQEVNESFE